MYTVVVVRIAQKELTRLPAADYQRVLAAIDALATTPCPFGCVKLTGSEFWRIRVGQYRVVYAIQDIELIVTVVKVGNRRDVYR